MIGNADNTIKDVEKIVEENHISITIYILMYRHTVLGLALQAALADMESTQVSTLDNNTFTSHNNNNVTSDNTSHIVDNINSGDINNNNNNTDMALSLASPSTGQETIRISPATKAMIWAEFDRAMDRALSIGTPTNNNNNTTAIAGYGKRARDFSSVIRPLKAKIVTGRRRLDATRDSINAPNVNNNNNNIININNRMELEDDMEEEATIDPIDVSSHTMSGQQPTPTSSPQGTSSQAAAPYYRNIDGEWTIVLPNNPIVYLSLADLQASGKGSSWSINGGGTTALERGGVNVIPIQLDELRIITRSVVSDSATAKKDKASKGKEHIAMDSSVKYGGAPSSLSQSQGVSSKTQRRVAEEGMTLEENDIKGNNNKRNMMEINYKTGNLSTGRKRLNR